MKRTILKAVGYSLFFLLAVLLFMYWTFPMDKVRHWAEQAALDKLKLNVSIGELDLAGLNGLEATDVAVRFRTKKAEEAEPAAGAAEVTPTSTAATGEGPEGGGGEAEAPAAAGRAERKPAWRTVRLDRVEAHVGLWDVIFNKRLDLRADLEALGGAIQGLHVLTDEGYKRWKLAVDEMEGLRLTLLPLEQWLGTAIKGNVSGNLSVELGKDLFTSRGTAQLEIEGAEVPRPELEQTLYGETQTFVLSDVLLGTVFLELTLDKKGNIPALGAKSTDQSTVLHLARVELSGGDLELGLDERSTITFNKGQGFENAYLNIHGSFRIAPTFFERQVEDEKPNLFLRTLLKGDPKWRQAERDGVYGFRCVGRPTFKSCTPTAPPVRGRYTPTARKKLVERGADDDEAGTPTSRAGGADAKGGRSGAGIRMIGDREDEEPDRGRTGFGRDRGRLMRPEREPDLPSLPAPPPLEPEEEPQEPAGEEPVPVEEAVPVEDEGVPVDEGAEGVPVEDVEPLPEGEPVEEPLPGEGGEELAPVEGEPEGEVVPEDELPPDDQPY